MLDAKSTSSVGDIQILCDFGEEIMWGPSVHSVCLGGVGLISIRGRKFVPMRLRCGSHIGNVHAARADPRVFLFGSPNCQGI